MGTLDPRIRKLHIARYGLIEDVDSYLRTLEGLRPLRDDEAGENHHMLAQSVWPEYKDLKANPWNRLRVSYAIHTALTEIQSWFEERLRFAALMMKGLSVEAAFNARSIAGKKGGKVSGRKNGTAQGKKNLESGQWDRVRCKDGRGGKIGGKIAVESGRIANMPTFESCSKGGQRRQELHPNLSSDIGKRAVESGRFASIATFESRSKGGRVTNCLLWNIRRDKPCTCGQHG